MKPNQKVIITKNGPYFISGKLPLSKVISIAGSSNEPEKWKKGKKYPIDEKYNLCRCGKSQNKPYCDGTHLETWYPRGLENFLTDFYLNKDFVVELLDITKNYSLDISKKLVELGVDIIWWGDDIATERGPYISPKLFRELLKPRYQQMVEEVRKINKNIKIAFHCDGDIEWAIEDFIDIGFNILNPLQPDANDIAKIKKKYGKKLTFWGNVDTRRVLNIGSFIDVCEEVRDKISLLSPGGGHILCTNHTIQNSDRAVDNTIAYYWAAEQFRKYPIKF